MPSTQSQAMTDHWSETYAFWTSGDFAASDPEAWGNLTSEPRGVDYAEVEVNGCTAMWLTPKECAADRVIMCVHGGGFVTGSIYTHRKLFAHLAKAAGVRALIASYGLAPENRHPSQLDQVSSAYRWLLDQDVDSGHIGMAGDSAAATLLLSTQLRAREDGTPLPAASMLISPWVDMSVSSDSFESNRNKDPFFKREVVQWLSQNVLGEASNTDPFASPLHADLTGLAPIYIQVGGNETLVGESVELERRAQKADVEVRLDIFDDMLHTFQMMAGKAPEADDAIQRFANWVRPKVGLGDN